MSVTLPSPSSVSAAREAVPGTGVGPHGAPRRLLFGVPVDALTMDGAMASVERSIERRERLLVGVVNAAKVVNMREDDELRRSVLEADMILADGMSVVWASRVLGRPLPERVTGIDLMTRMLERGDRKGWKVYLLGATEEVSRKVAFEIARRYRGVQVVGRRDGYFDSREEERIAKEIRDSKADILLVAMTSPKKERFIARWFEAMEVPVCHGVGGSFDVMAGKVSRAPLAWQRFGLEWAHRVLQEPGRLWKRYLLTNLRFAGLVLSGLVRRPLGG